MRQVILLPASPGTRFRDDYGAMVRANTATQLNRTQSVLPVLQFILIATRTEQYNAN